MDFASISYHVQFNYAILTQGIYQRIMAFHMEIWKSDLKELSARKRKAKLISRILQYLYKNRASSIGSAFTLIRKYEDINRISLSSLSLREIIKKYHGQEVADYLQPEYLNKDGNCNISFIEAVEIPVELFVLLILEGFTRNEILDIILSHRLFLNLPLDLYDQVANFGYTDLSKKVCKFIKADFWEAKNQYMRDEFFARQFVRSFVLARSTLRKNARELIEKFVKEKILVSKSNLDNYPEFYCLNVDIIGKKRVGELIYLLPGFIQNPMENASRIFAERGLSLAFKKALLAGEAQRIKTA